MKRRGKAKMKPMHLIMREILRQAKQEHPEKFDFGPLDTTEQVGEAYDRFCDMEANQDYESEFRQGQVETGLSCERSRHYESKSVAAKTAEGQWVGWTYWYGGGKHGEPGGIPWMEDAYLLDCLEMEKVVVVRTFERVKS